MSSTIVLGVVPDRRPVEILRLSNAWGWAASIWHRLLTVNGLDPKWMTNDAGLDELCGMIESLPEWQQAPLLLTFDLGVIPWQAFDWAAEMLAEFDRRLPEVENWANHVPAVSDLFRSKPEVPLIGIHGTTVSGNPFDGWESDDDVHGIPLSRMDVLPQHLAMVGLSLIKSQKAPQTQERPL